MGDVTRTYRRHVPLNYQTSNDVPVPLVIDYHGWGEDAWWHESESKFTEVADNFDEEGFLVISPNGMDDNTNPGYWGSFNVSWTNGPMGPSCDTDKSQWGETPCYSSCTSCDPTNSCDWTTCYDDVAFTSALLEAVSEELCVNLDSIHQSGYSNGAMFNYFSISRLSGVFASLAPVSGTPMLGFGDLPSVPTSLIDFHGLNDGTVPYDLEHSQGEGPHNTIISGGGGYFYEKEAYLRTWREGLGCILPGEAWPTPMDGVDGWACIVWGGCTDGVEVVGCTGGHGHNYPFAEDSRIEAAKILWSFMKSHAKN